jgi:hypothetical protein
MEEKNSFENFGENGTSSRMMDFTGLRLVE